MMENDLLKYAIDSGMIDLSYVRERIEMNKREEILKKYGSCIWYSEKEDSWYCHIPDETKKNGRKKVKRKKKKDIEDIVYKYYSAQEKKEEIKINKSGMTLKELFLEFIEYKSKEVTSRTIKRMMIDWNRFYVGAKLIEIPINEITKIDIDIFFNTVLEDNELKPKAFYNMCGLLKQSLQYAVDAEYIEKSPYRTKVNKKKFVPDHKKSSDLEVYQDDEKVLIIQEMERRFANNPKNTAPLAVILDFELGVRKGELLALCWSDIKDGWIHIHKQVVGKFDTTDMTKIKKTGFEVVDYTKSSDGDRWIPLSDKAIDIIRRIKKTNVQYNNAFEDYLFVINGHIMSPDAIDAQIKRGCEYIGMKVKTMHKIRKTYGSTLLHNGVNISAVKDMLGHADESTTMKHYIYNTENDTKTREMVIEALGDQKVTKSDQKIIHFPKNKIAENPVKTRLSTMYQSSAEEGT